MSHIAPLPYQHPIIWVLIADGHKAMAYLRVPGAETITHARHQPEEILTWNLQPVEDFVFTAESVQAYDTGVDARATIYERNGYIRHLSEPHIELSHRIKDDLARHVAEKLDKAKAEGRFDELVIVAPPAWLGLLRPHLARPLRDAVLIEVPKDFANLPLHELTLRLREVFPARGT